MRVDLKDKFMWFVFLELISGFASSVVYINEGGRMMYYGSRYGYLKDLRDDVYNALQEAIGSDRRSNSGERIEYMIVDLFISGAFVPMLFRFQVYAYKKELATSVFFTLIIFPMVMYLTGAVILLARYEKNTPTTVIVKGSFALIAGIFLFIDAICYILA